MHLKKIIALSILITSGVSFSKDKKKDYMVYGETGRLTKISPYTSHETSAQRLSDLLFNSLVELSDNGTYQPSLADSWKINKDYTAITFKLHPKVKWHASKHFLSSDDIATTVRLILDKNSQIPNKERFNVISSVEKIDPLTVTINLSRPQVDPLRYMSFKILPHHILSQTASLTENHSFAKKPIGTGPYQFKSSNSQGEIVLTANPDYFKGAPKIKGIVMKSYADQSIMSQSLMFNSLDLITYVSPRDLGEISGDKKLTVIPYDALSFSFIALNTSRGILKKKRVRQALNYAVNRQEMLDAFFGGKGRLISGPFPPTSWAYNLDVKVAPFDQNKAKKLLETAGLTYNKHQQLLSPSKKPVKLVFAVPLAGESETIKRIVLAYQGYLSSIGITVDLQFMDWQVWKKRVLERHDYDLTIASWSFDDASNIASLFHSSSAKPWGNNFVMYKNEEVDSLLTEALVTNDFEKRRAIYHKLHAIMADEAPYTYLWTLKHHAAHTSNLRGVKIEPFAFFKHITSWKLKSKNI